MMSTLTCQRYWTLRYIMCIIHTTHIYTTVIDTYIYHGFYTTHTFSLIFSKYQWKKQFQGVGAWFSFLSYYHCYIPLQHSYITISKKFLYFLFGIYHIAYSMKDFFSFLLKLGKGRLKRWHKTGITKMLPRAPYCFTHGSDGVFRISEHILNVYRTYMYSTYIGKVIRCEHWARSNLE